MKIIIDRTFDTVDYICMIFLFLFCAVVFSAGIFFLLMVV